MHPIPTRFPLVRLVCVLAAAGICSVQAASPVLSNSPINQQNLVKPNILFMMDRSGSMASHHVPDEATSGSTNMSGKAGYFNWHCNALAYNPNTVYAAPINGDGSVIATMANVPAGSSNRYTAAYDNGFGGTGGTKYDLTTFTGNGSIPVSNFYFDLKSTATAPTSYADSKCRENVAATTTSFNRVDVNTLTAAQQQNYANWFAYYRNRLLMMKTAVGFAFRNLSSDVRFAYMTIDTTPGQITNSSTINSFLPIATMDQTQKNSFYTKLYGLGTSGSTPLREALSGAGLYFANRYTNQPVLANGPSTGGECQRNFTILSTDGYWNELNGNTNPINKKGTADLGWTSATSTGGYVGDQDSNGSDAFSKRTPATGSPYTSEGQWSNNQATGTTTTTDTLADVALYYYKSDLLPSYRKLDPNRDSFTNSDGTTNTPSLAPPYLYRNMVTHTVGVGVAGTLKYVTDYATNTDGTKNDFYNIKNGSQTWPSPANNLITTADDLWHAAVNGRGTFFSANNAAAMAQGLSRTLADITADTVFNVAPVTSSPVLTNDNNVSYKTNYRSGSWTGRLNAVLLDPTTGSEVTAGTPPVALLPIWRGHLKLDRQAGAYDPSTTPATPATTGWLTSRKIFLGSPTAGTALPFLHNNLTAAQKAVLQDGVANTFLTGQTPSITKAYSELVLEYLRGSQQYEENITGVRENALLTLPLFRGRGDDTYHITANPSGDKTQGILGDIVNAKPVVVSTPKEAYLDSENPGYDAFKLAKATRTPMIYVGANDGMLHAFNAENAAGTGINKVATANSGKEEWAYIPSLLIHSDLDEGGSKYGLQTYSYPIGGTPQINIPPAKKHAFIDGSLQTNDVDFNRTDTSTGGSNGAPDWRTLLVGALGKGGKGYFALDVTYGDKEANGTSPLTETTAANKFLWEFAGVPSGGTPDPDMGYSFGNAVISRSETYGWITAVTSGYNNASGKGAVWVLNAKSGQVIKKFTIAPTCATTGDCVVESGLSASNPLNLAKIVGYVYSIASEKLLAMYGGDMQGNVWRIDVSDLNKNNWTIKKLAKLTAPAASGTSVANGLYGNNWQPVTTAPTVQWDSETDRRWVFVGTGMDLSPDDRDSTKNQAKQTQTMYAIIDGSGATPLTLPLPSGQPVTRSNLDAGDAETVGALTPSAGSLGWYIDLKAPSGLDLAERIVLQPVARFGAVVFDSSTPVTDVCLPGYSGKSYARGYLEGQLGASFILQNGVPVKYVSNQAGYAANPSLVVINGETKLKNCNLKGECTTEALSPPGLNKRARISWRELLNQ
ncbi:pilus assembly protein [Chitinimonas naiadis]